LIEYWRLFHEPRSNRSVFVLCQVFIRIGMSVVVRIIVKSVDTLLGGEVKSLSAMLTNGNSELWVE